MEQAHIHVTLLHFCFYWTHVELFHSNITHQIVNEWINLKEWTHGKTCDNTNTYVMSGDIWPNVYLNSESRITCILIVTISKNWTRKPRKLNDMCMIETCWSVDLNQLLKPSQKKKKSKTKPFWTTIVHPGPKRFKRDFSWWDYPPPRHIN